jgi:hypothetical protein
MTALDPNNAKELASQEVFFWNSLRNTLSLVYEADPALADYYRRTLAKAPPLQRALALHDEPLDAASTLTGVAPTADHIVKYDTLRELIETESERPHIAAQASDQRTLILSRLRDDNSPMVPVKVLNRVMHELGYQKLSIKRGVASFHIEPRRRGRPFPVVIDMSHLPGLTADRDEVYSYASILGLLDALQEFARQKNAASTLLQRISQVRNRFAAYISKFE